MTTFYLVRHGQTDWNVEGRYQGHTDIPLNQAGRQQAHELADKMAVEGTSFAAIYASDLMRARETAEILAIRLNLAVYPDCRLREVCHGEWEGQLVRDIARVYPEIGFGRRPSPDFHAPGGESVSDAAIRMARAADSFAQAYPGDRPILIVSHGLALASLTCLAEADSLSSYHKFIPGNAAPRVITWQSGRFGNS